MKKIIILLLTLTVLTSSACATESISITDTSGLVSLAEDETSQSSDPEDGELVADQEVEQILEDENETSTNALLKPFEEYSPADLFTLLILLIKIFENVIKLFIHKWGLLKW